ncbi:hypothetical protein K8638_22365 [Myxococcus sp. RHST-1-4]|nr:hypothetical protein [Myxococcus sp. RHSTA-1-4]MBZ4419224.1 hypothetical protein [Myxococcus sp. RHSTA-1-4]
MPRLVQSLEAWDAVRLGALGPLLSANAAEALQQQRAAFLVSAVEKYGLPRAEVFALFVLHSAFDDELPRLLSLLAGDKRLGDTLGAMASAREELQRRGVHLAQYPDRTERAADVLRGLGHAGRDALSSTPVSDGARYMDLTAKRAQLPPPYQHALDEVEQALMQRHYAPESVALGGFDHLTFGVPLGFYHLVAGTRQGASSLAEGHYEQATRELTPAALMVALYAGGRGVRHLAEAPATGWPPGVRGLPVDGLKAVVNGLGERLGGDALRELARYLQSSREAGLLVAEGGEAAAAALLEARGSVPRARHAWLSQADSPRPGQGTGAGKGGGGAVAAVQEAAGFHREALEARWLQVEREAPGPRLSADVAVLEKQRPLPDAPPPGAAGHALWGEYVAYWERRLGDLRQRKPVEGPRTWQSYQMLRELFARGLAFERGMVALLQADAARPRAQRQWLANFNQPRLETHVGVWKPEAGLRYVDVLVIEEQPPAGQQARVETFSFKSRDLSLLKENDLKAQMRADAREALDYYGETLNIRRPALRLRDVQVQVQQVRLIYEGGALKPRRKQLLETSLDAVEKSVVGVEVSFQ